MVNQWIPLSSAHVSVERPALQCESSEAALLGARPLVAVKETLQGVDLSGGNTEHDEQVEAGPEGHPPQVVLQEEAVPRLEGPQRGLDLTGLLQSLVHGVHRRLEEEEQNNGKEEMIRGLKGTIKAPCVSLSPWCPPVCTPPGCRSWPCPPTQLGLCSGCLAWRSPQRTQTSPRSYWSCCRNTAGNLHSPCESSCRKEKKLLQNIVWLIIKTQQNRRVY